MREKSKYDFHRASNSLGIRIVHIRIKRGPPALQSNHWWQSTTESSLAPCSRTRTIQAGMFLNARTITKTTNRHAKIRKVRRHFTRFLVCFSSVFFFFLKSKIFSDFCWIVPVCFRTNLCKKLELCDEKRILPLSTNWSREMGLVCVWVVSCHGYPLPPHHRSNEEPTQSAEATKAQLLLCS